MNQGFNRGSSGAGRRRSLALMPGESSGEGTTGNKIPRGTTLASVRRGQALLRMMNDRLPAGQDFSRGTTRAGRRRNFALMAGIQAATPTTGVQVYDGSTSAGPALPASVSWDGENYDPEGWWSSGTVLTCPTSGTYDVEYSFDVSQVSPSATTVIVTINGSGYDTQVFSSGVTPITKTQSVVFTAGDTISIGVDGGTATTFNNGLLTIG
jgi:hypothetical protein